MTKISLDRIADAFGMSDAKKPDVHSYGTVSSVNIDGSLQVTLDGSTTTVRASAMCLASKGDRVICAIYDGHVAAVGCVGGGVTVLYSDDNGSTDEITLSKSSADFDHMRIFYGQQNDLIYSSVDVWKPDGKRVQMSVCETSGANCWVMGRCVTVSGNKITTYGDYYGQTIANGSSSFNHVNNIKIYRVEAW